MPGQDTTTGASKADRKPLIRRFASDTGGATSIEYGVMAVLLAVPLLTTLTFMRTELVGLLGTVAEAMSGALGGS